MLTTKTKYAIIALVRLAREYQQKPLLIRDIAQQEGIPKKFLEAILRDLKNAGILASKKGRNGGYLLNQPPEDVNIAQIIRLFDGAIAYNMCVTHLYFEPCLVGKNESCCGIATFFKEARDAAVKIFKEATLKNIMDREKELNRKK